MFPVPRTSSVTAASLGHGWSPRPTAPPPNLELLKRQASNEETYYIASDNTCGFIEASKDTPFDCYGESNTCYMVVRPGFYAGWGCISQLRKGVATRCYDNDTMSACDTECMLNGDNLFCTETVLFGDHCNTYQMYPSFTHYQCASSDHALISVYMTYSGMASDLSFSTLVSTLVDPAPTSQSSSLESSQILHESSAQATQPSPESSTRPAQTSSETSNTSPVSDTSQTSSTSQTPTTSQTSLTSQTHHTSQSHTSPPHTSQPHTPQESYGSQTNSSTAGGTSPAPSPPSATGAGSGSTTPTGPIVGGAVGGTAFLFFVGFGIFFFHRQKKTQPPPMRQKPSDGALEIVAYPDTSAPPLTDQSYPTPPPGPSYPTPPPSQLQELPSRQLQVSPSQNFHELPPTHLQMSPPQQFQELSSQQFQEFPPHQLQELASQQYPNLAPQQLHELSPQQQYSQLHSQPINYRGAPPIMTAAGQSVHRQSTSSPVSSPIAHSHTDSRTGNFSPLSSSPLSTATSQVYPQNQQQYQQQQYQQQHQQHGYHHHPTQSSGSTYPYNSTSLPLYPSPGPPNHPRPGHEADGSHMHEIGSQ
ncbi:hypothetical protein B0T24DRAFT_628502 [Lasiosphaeria ovina]|uniref:Uncharacterized protein n=1 Tax=Lasiosphaeria ovina TaxID=92902 RepID=A0AAE0K8F0_9PEZI|nr:hypothetical protein B0T24DRAFT_628502 [Lasiosphaeria ovina]